jgi:hypothetical protein
MVRFHLVSILSFVLLNASPGTVVTAFTSSLQTPRATSFAFRTQVVRQVPEAPSGSSNSRRKRTYTHGSTLRWMTADPDEDDHDACELAKTESQLSTRPPVDKDADDDNRRRRMRKRVRELARNVVAKPLSYAAPMPQAVAAVLRDATMKAVDMAVEEVMNRRTVNGENGNAISSSLSTSSLGGGVSSDVLSPSINVDAQELIDEAFLPLEQSLQEMEDALVKARKSMLEAKSHASDAVEAVQAAAIAQTAGAVTAVAAAEEAANEKVMADIYAAAESGVNVTGLNFHDVDYNTSEMAPPFLGEDQCLVPGEPVIRVEKAPENSRRIFAGIDIMASVDDVWNLLTDYGNLQNVIPNLVVNEVMDLYDASQGDLYVDSSQPEDAQCQQIANQMKGALLRQVGGAKVAGINFSARTKLEVREWPQGLPNFAHFDEKVWEGRSRKDRAKDYEKYKLERYRFPRPFAVSSLPTRDISMQSIVNDDGEFRMYQGVWRMQPLPGCAPNGKEAMRLTYAVEVSPRSYLPVQLIERRIAADLCTNLVAIRDYAVAAGGVPAPS